MNAAKIQQIMSFVILAAVIVAGAKCSVSHEPEHRAGRSHEDGGGLTRIKAQSRISMSKTAGYGARVQIHEDLHGRKHAHAMAICDCNGQGPWRPLFKPSEIIKTEFPEHESFHEEVDSQYRNLVDGDNHLRQSDHGSAGSDSSEGGGSFGGGFGGGGEVGAAVKKHNHMIHLHLIPHIYVPVVHSGTGFSEAKNAFHHATVGEGPSPLSPSPVHHHTSDPSHEFPTGSGGDAIGGIGSAHGVPSGPGENAPSALNAPLSADGDHDHGITGAGNFNGHSGETPYYTTLPEEQVHHHQHQDLQEDFGNTLDDPGTHQHDYEVSPNSVPGEPHQYQVHEYDDLNKDYSNKKHVTSMSAASSSMVGKQPHQQHKQHRKAAAVRRNRTKHGRMLSNRQDLKNLLVMRPPPMGQSQTWRYVYRSAPPASMMAAHHQYYQRKMPALMPSMLKTKTVPLILHIRQRSDD